MSATDARPCFADGHVHDPASPGACWEAACLPSCPAHEPGEEPFSYEPAHTCQGDGAGLSPAQRTDLCPRCQWLAAGRP